MNPSIQSLKLVAVAFALAASACIAQSGEDAQSSQTEQLGVQSQTGGGAGLVQKAAGSDKARNPLLVQPNSLGGGVTEQHLEGQMLQFNSGDPSNGDNTDNGDGNDPTPVPWAPVTRYDSKSSH
jgi:hypothetical protein